MAKKYFRTAFLVIIIVIEVCGCVTNTATPNIPRWAYDPSSLGNMEFTILGPVEIESKWHGVLGISILSFFGISMPKFDNGTYMFQRGGVTYADFLAHAREKYSNADAVINITIEQKESDYVFVIYSQRIYVMTGIAISYQKENVALSQQISDSIVKSDKNEIVPFQNSKSQTPLIENSQGINPPIINGIPVFNEPNSIIVDIWEYGKRYNEYIKISNFINSSRPLRFTIFGLSNYNTQWVLLGAVELKNDNNMARISPPGYRNLGQYRWIAIQPNDKIKFKVNVTINTHDINFIFYDP